MNSLWVSHADAVLRPLVEEAGGVAVLVALEVGHEAADVDEGLLQQARAHRELVGKVLLKPGIVDRDGGHIWSHWVTVDHSR